MLLKDEISLFINECELDYIKKGDKRLIILVYII